MCPSSFFHAALAYCSQRLSDAQYQLFPPQNCFKLFESKPNYSYGLLRQAYFFNSALTPSCCVCICLPVSKIQCYISQLIGQGWKRLLLYLIRYNFRFGSVWNAPLCQYGSYIYSTIQQRVQWWLASLVIYRTTKYTWV